MKVRYRIEAAHDLQAIHEFVARENPAAARRIIARLRGEIERLSRFPRSGRQGTVPGTRELVVPPFPYVVVYAVDREGEGFIDIIAVIHAARRPRNPA